MWIRMTRAHPHTVETAFNPELARQLRARHPRWREGNTVTAEQTGTVAGQTRKRPDIVIRHPGALPVIVETEFAPARSVEQEARGRLGAIIDGKPVEGVLAVRVPQELAHVDQGQLGAAITGSRFVYCLVASRDPTPLRYPVEGWLSGTIDQLADAIEAAALSETRLAAAAERLEAGVGNGAARLRSERTTRPDMFTAMAGLLHQEDSEQTTRMAVAMIANALVFQSAISGNHAIPSPEEMQDSVTGRVTKTGVHEVWRRILAINYWPIFAIAQDLLGTIPAAVAHPFLDDMVDLATELAGLGTASMHDLSGQMFQRLITDRKFLATFYTRPASATLLATLALARLDVDWGDASGVTALRIADFACGTGSLLGAAQQAVARQHRRGGGDDRTLHRALMERVLFAADIMPAATHLTASTLSSAHPGTVFGGTQIHTMPYGARPERTDIGALDLIVNEQQMSLFGDGAATQAAGDGEATGLAVLEHESCDLVIMNPPFTRPTNHESTEIPVPSFAGFATSGEEQRVMSDRLQDIQTHLKHQASRSHLPLPLPAGHGNAGLASNFIDLAHTKLRAGGQLALILPAAFVQGASWQPARDLLRQAYQDVLLIGIGTDGSTDRAFSADTGMAEVLVVASRRLTPTDTSPCRALAVTLRWRPDSRLEGSVLADCIELARAGTATAGHLTLGPDVRVGSYVRAGLEDACKAIGVNALTIVDTLIHLADGHLPLPRQRHPIALPLCRLGDLGDRGVVHRDINGADGRGPFAIQPIEAGTYPEWPALWNHDAKQECRLVVPPDTEGVVRPGCADRAQTLWDRTASHLHFSCDFRINSQPLAACLTERCCIGGRAWPNFRVTRADWELPLLLWANSTLGIMAFWWHGTRQQQGRSCISISRLPDLLTLDARALSAVQIEACEALFQRFRAETFLPANEACRDTTRQALDAALLVDVLGLEAGLLDNLAILREQWCREPSVHGGKATAP